MRDHDDDKLSRGGKAQGSSTLRSELVRYLLELPDETRAKLLAFLHLVEDVHLVDAHLHIDRAGDIHMKLFKNLRAKSRRGRESDSEPLQ